MDEQKSGGRPGTRPTVTVEANGEPRLAIAGVEDPFDATEATYDMRCSSGDQLGGRWRGVSVAALLDAASVPAETTHVLVGSVDGVSACLPLPVALDSIVAFERLDAESSSLPRFVGERVSGTQSIKQVSRLVAVELAPDEDPASYEARRLDAPG